MGVFVQGKQAQSLERLRLAARRVTPRPAPPAKLGVTAPKPGWLILFFDLCWLAGLLILTLYISWVYDKLPAGDPVEYHTYAVAFWKATPSFHLFPKEYPPLALIPFSLTLFPASSVHFYWVFAFWMGVIVCLSYLWFARVISRPKAIAYALYLLVGAMGTLLMRFDVLPALVTLGALLLAERKRFGWAYALLAIGVLLKLYPGFLVPVLAAYQWRVSALPQAARAADGLDGDQTLARLWGMLWAGKAVRQAQMRELGRRGKSIVSGLAVFTGVTFFGFSVPALVNLQGTLSEFKYALTRPIQIESAPATLLWLGNLLGFPTRPNVSFVSLNLVGPLDSAIKLLSMEALIGGTLYVCWRVLRGKLTLGQAFVAMIGVVLVSNKLLSPQYLMWILPLVAYVEGLDALWLVICALTTLIFPFIYQTHHPIITVPDNPAFFPTIALRNLLLVIATVRAVRGRRPATAGQAPAEAEAHLRLPALPDSVPARERVPTLLYDRLSEEERQRLIKTTSQV